jgi:hypothetical protein
VLLKQLQAKIAADDLKTDDDGLLEKILQLSLAEEKQSSLELLLRYGQTNDILKELAQYANKQNRYFAIGSITGTFPSNVSGYFCMGQYTGKYAIFSGDSFRYR